MLVTIPYTKTKNLRVFTIVDEGKAVSYLELSRKYVSLRLVRIFKVQVVGTAECYTLHRTFGTLPELFW